jgi:aromatic ring hydroxylase
MNTKTILLISIIVIGIIAIILMLNKSKKTEQQATVSTKITEQEKTGGIISGAKGIFSGLNVSLLGA